MSDNDILFDDSFCTEIREYMKLQGYKTTYIEWGNHDVYRKEPVYNFELHRALYGVSHRDNWNDYYRDVKSRLIRDSSTSYRYHFTDEDFDVYIVSHAYKHYSGSGTGIRSLLDLYVYLAEKEQKMDFTYISNECRVLGIDEFEENSRGLCKKIFSKAAAYDKEALEKRLSEKEREMLSYYLSSGVYGNTQNYVENLVREKGTMAFLKERLFLPLDVMRGGYPVLEKAPFLLPVFWMFRFILVAFIGERRENAKGQIRAFMRLVKSSRRETE